MCSSCAAWRPPAMCAHDTGQTSPRKPVKWRGGGQRPGYAAHPDAPHAVEVDAGQRLVRRRKAYRPAAGSPAAAVLQASADLGVGRSFRAVIVAAGHPRRVRVGFCDVELGYYG